MNMTMNMTEKMTVSDSDSDSDSPCNLRMKILEVYVIRGIKFICTSFSTSIEIGNLSHVSASCSPPMRKASDLAPLSRNAAHDLGLQFFGKVSTNTFSLQ